MRLHVQSHSRVCARAVAGGKRGGKGRGGREEERGAARWGEEEAGIRFSNRRYISTINIFVTYRFSAVGTFAYAFRKSFVKYAAGNLRLSLEKPRTLLYERCFFFFNFQGIQIHLVKVKFHDKKVWYLVSTYLYKCQISIFVSQEVQ